MNTKMKGSIAELAVALALMSRGYSVAFPFGENDPYDLIAESPSGKLYRIQVRSTKWKGDVLHLSLRTTSKNYKRTIDKSRIDVFCAWDGETVLVIPTEVIGSRSSTLNLRKSMPKSNQANVHMASTYDQAWDKMP